MKIDGSHATPSMVGAQIDRLARFTHIAASGLGVVLLIFLSVWFVWNGRPASLELHFNPYALLSLVSLVSNLTAFIFIIRVRERSQVQAWFSAFILSLAAWAAAEAFFRFSATPAAASFWSPVTTLGAVCMPICLYMFALSYTDPKRTFSPYVFPILLAVSIVFIHLDTTTNLLTNYDPRLMIPYPWGFISKTGPAYILITLWLVLLSLAAFLLLFRYRRSSIEPVLRKQTKLFMIAIAIPLVGGGLTDGILPAFHVEFLPPMSVMLLTVMGIIISYGIMRHQFFSFTPSLIATHILDTMNEAVLGLRPDFSISYVNKGAERLLGISANKLSHMSIAELLINKLDQRELQSTIFKPLQENDFHTIDSIIFHGPHNPITAKLSITNLSDESQPYGYLVVITDITAIAHTKSIIERQVAEQTKTIRETKSNLVSSINSLQFGFIISDSRPEVIMTNDTAHKLFCIGSDHASEDCTSLGLARIQELLGKSVPITKIIRKCLTTHKPAGIKLITFHDRSWRLFVSPVFDGDHTLGTTIIFQDITEEQVLARSRDEFFSIASHELRTPLTAIKGNTSMMLQYYPTSFKDPALKEMAVDIHDSSVRLISIVNDFLDASRLEQNKVIYKLEAVSLIAIVQKIAYEFEATSKEKHIYIRLGTGLSKNSKIPKVIADSDRLKQVIYNLVGNALKFTEQGGLTIDATQERETISLSVTDTGRGIEPKMQALLFHKFQQANASLLTRDTTRGTGLGLYISRLLMKGMGGTLELDASTPSEGSTFSITLPKATAERIRSIKPTTQTDTKTGLTT